MRRMERHHQAMGIPVSTVNLHGIFAGQSSSDKPGRPVIRGTEALNAKIYRFRCLAKANAYLRS
jgi:hypothetical protein